MGKICYNMHFKSVKNHHFFTVFKLGSSMWYAICKMTCVSSKDSDQPGHLHSLNYLLEGWSESLLSALVNLLVLSCSNFSEGLLLIQLVFCSTDISLESQNICIWFRWDYPCYDVRNNITRSLPYTHWLALYDCCPRGHREIQKCWSFYSDGLDLWPWTCYISWGI